MISNLCRAWAVLACFVLAVCATSTRAAFPDDKPVLVVVPVAAGGSTDATCRVIGQRLGQKWKQTVIINNRPGANGEIARNSIATSSPDGYTLYCDSGSYAVEASRLDKPTFNPAKSLVPISRVAAQPRILISNPAYASSRFKNLKEFVTYAKANPGKLQIGHGGNGSDTYLVSIDFMIRTGVDLILIPFSQGSSRSLAAVLGNEIPLGWTTAGVAIPQSQAGKLTILAVTSARRYPQLPDIMTVAEAINQPDWASETWVGYWAPAGTPQAMIARVRDDIASVMSTPEAVQLMDNLGLRIINSTSRDFADFIVKDIARNREVFKTAKDRYGDQ